MPALSSVNGSTLQLSGGASLSLPTVTSAAAASFEVSGGSSLELAGLTAYTDPSATPQLEATGAGSVLSLPNVTSIVETGAFNTVNIEALTGGDVELPLVTQITGGVELESNSAASTLDVTDLTTFTGGTLAFSGGTLGASGSGQEMPAARGVNGSTLQLSGGASLSLPTVTSATAASFEVSGGSSLELTGLTAYMNPSSNTTLRGDGCRERAITAQFDVDPRDGELCHDCCRGPGWRGRGTAVGSPDCRHDGAREQRRGKRNQSVGPPEPDQQPGNGLAQDYSGWNGDRPRSHDLRQRDDHDRPDGHIQRARERDLHIPEQHDDDQHRNCPRSRHSESQQGSAVLTIKGGLTINGGGGLSTSSGSTLNVSGNLVGNTTSAAAFNPLGTVILDSAQGTVNPPQLLEAMSQDLGNVAAGFNSNFAFSTLELTANTYVELVDNAANSPGNGPEALYVNKLIVPAGATLNLDGLHLYAQTEQINGTVVSGGATISGEVFNDLNDNGVLEGGEPGLSGWTVELTNTSTDATYTTMTDSSGLYSLVGVSAGTFTLSEVVQSGFVQTAARVSGNVHGHRHVGSERQQRGFRGSRYGVDQRHGVQRLERRRVARGWRAGPFGLDGQSA